MLSVLMQGAGRRRAREAEERFQGPGRWRGEARPPVGPPTSPHAGAWWEEGSPLSLGSMGGEQQCYSRRTSVSLVQSSAVASGSPSPSLKPVPEPSLDLSLICSDSPVVPESLRDIALVLGPQLLLLPCT